jgi:type IV fimbrial biogenesis protein FimT
MNGFSIMELLITMLVASILVGVAVPSFRGMIVSNRLTTQSNEFVGAINLARSAAITRNMTITFCRADAATDTVCSADNDPWAAWIVRNAAGEVLRNGAIDDFDGSLLVTSDLTNQSLEFRADGLARTGGVVVAEKVISVCVTSDIAANFRSLTIGAGSRVSTTKSAGACS